MDALLSATAAQGACAISVSNSISVAIDRCVLIQKSPGEKPPPLVEISQLVMDISLSNSLLIGGTGLASRGQGDRPWTLAAALTVRRNLFLCTLSGIDCDPATLYFLNHTIRDNTFVGCSVAGVSAFGTVLSGQGGVSRVEISRNILHASGDAVVAGLDDLTISGNSISADADSKTRSSDKSGIRILSKCQSPEATPGVERCHILENRIDGCAGYGIVIKSAVESLMIKQNFIEDIGNTGIHVDADATVADLAIENNQFRHIGVKPFEDKMSDAWGIVLQRVQSGRIAGNSFRFIGDATAGLRECGAISLRGCGRIQVTEITADDIGPATSNETDVSVFDVRFAVTTAAFDRNRAAGTGNSWCALRVLHDVQQRAEAVMSDLYETLVYVPIQADPPAKTRLKRSSIFDPAKDSVTWTPGGLRVWRSPKNSIELTGNTVEGTSNASLVDVHAEELTFNRNTINGDRENAKLPMIALEAGQCEIIGNRLTGTGPQALAAKVLHNSVQSGVCLFNDNRVDLTLDGEGDLLYIEAEAAIVHANYVKAKKSTGNVHIVVNKTKEEWDCTVLGNIVGNGAIKIGNAPPAPLAPPWDSLNHIQ